MNHVTDFLDILRKAVEDGRTVTIKADEITIKSDEIMASAPEITVE